MDHTIETHEGFEVVGLELRTSNSAQGPEGPIARAWGALMSQAKRPPCAIAAYVDYASDANGDYTFLLGERGDPDTLAREGAARARIEPGRFAVFRSDTPLGVIEVWQHVWQSGLARSFRGGDFEVHDLTTGSARVYVRIA